MPDPLAQRASWWSGHPRPFGLSSKVAVRQECLTYRRERKALFAASIVDCKS